MTGVLLLILKYKSHIIRPKRVCDDERNANPITLSSFCHPRMVSFEGSRCESCYRSSEAVTSAVPRQISGSLEFSQRRFLPALSGPQGSAQRNAALIIKVTGLCNQWAYGPLHHMTALPECPLPLATADNEAV